MPIPFKEQLVFIHKFLIIIKNKKDYNIDNGVIEAILYIMLHVWSIISQD